MDDLKLFICWVVKVDKSKVYYESFYEALSDYKDHDSAFIYPLIKNKYWFNQLEEHGGY